MAVVCIRETSLAIRSISLIYPTQSGGLVICECPEADNSAWLTIYPLSWIYSDSAYSCTVGEIPQPQIPSYFRSSHSNRIANNAYGGPNLLGYGNCSLRARHQLVDDLGRRSGINVGVNDDLPTYFVKYPLQM